jgi:hypothetical protein
MTKPKDVKIISIAVAASGPLDSTVFGLGDDGNVYWWDTNDGKWKLHRLN